MLAEARPARPDRRADAPDEAVRLVGRRARARAARRRPRGGLMAILVDERSRVAGAGHHRARGRLPRARACAPPAPTSSPASRPGTGGQTVEGVPVFDSRRRRGGAASGADVAVLFVPARFARDAMIEAADAGIRLIVCVTEGIPARDMAEVMAHLPRRGCTLIGPNGPGLITPRALQRRHHAGRRLHARAPSASSRARARSPTRSSTSSPRPASASRTVVGMGGDPVHGIGFIECLELFEADRETEAVVLIGEIGGDDEERAAEFVKRAHDQAGGGLRRRLQRAARQAHGPRRRHRGGLVGHGRRARRRPWRLPASRWRAAPSERRPACSERRSRGEGRT